MNRYNLVAFLLWFFCTVVGATPRLAPDTNAYLLAGHTSAGVMSTQGDSVMPRKYHASARVTDIHLGSITHHIIVRDGVEEKFEGKIAFGGRTIYNGLLGLGVTDIDGDVYETRRLFLGQNSLHNFMFGAAYGGGYHSPYIDYGFIVGMYGQNHRFYAEKGLRVFSFVIKSTDLIPIIGGEVVFHYALTPHIDIGLANVVTPALSNHALRIRIRM
jgi:hypothetical protein